MDVVCTCALSCGLNVHVLTSLSWCVHVCVIYCVWECASVSVWIQAFITLFTCQAASLSYKFGAATEILLGAYVEKNRFWCMHS